MSWNERLPPESIRHYEKLGLLQAPQRGAQGYRRYDQTSLERIGFIRHGRHLGLDLQSIQELLSLADNPDTDCTLADELRQVVHTCRGGKSADCRIIGSLYRHGDGCGDTGCG